MISSVSFNVWVKFELSRKHGKVIWKLQKVLKMHLFLFGICFFNKTQLWVKVYN